MGEAFRGPGGGLPAAARALLVPENIRAGVHIEGGGVNVMGTANDIKTALGVSVAFRGGRGGALNLTHESAPGFNVEDGSNNTKRILRAVWAGEVTLYLGAGTAQWGTSSGANSCSIYVDQNGTRMLTVTATDRGNGFSGSQQSVQFTVSFGDIIQIATSGGTGMAYAFGCFEDFKKQ